MARRLHVSSADGLSRGRIAPLLECLAERGWRVTTDKDLFDIGRATVAESSAPPPEPSRVHLIPRLDPGTIWLLGWPAAPSVVLRAIDHRGPVYVWSMNDDEDFVDVPEPLYDVARKLLRLSWRWDSPHGKRGFLHPFLRFDAQPIGLNDFRQRSRVWFFSGRLTHPMRRAWHAALGQSMSESIARADYWAALGDTQICLAPPGKHPLTYRFFEGMIAGCLVVAGGELARHEFLGGVRPWEHYLIVDEPSELPRLVKWYGEHPSLSEKMAKKAQAMVLDRLITPLGQAQPRLVDAVLDSWELE